MSTIALHSTLNISETIRDRGLIPMTTNRKWHMDGYQLITWPTTSRDPHKCCEAVRSAILATAWLLVLNRCDANHNLSRSTRGVQRKSIAYRTINLAIAGPINNSSSNDRRHGSREGGYRLPHRRAAVLLATIWYTGNNHPLSRTDQD